jgi:hypothetical protein
MTRKTSHGHCGNFGDPLLSRREMLQRAGMGFGSLALAWLLAEDQRLSAADGSSHPPAPHFTPRAKSVIFLFMGGGPSQVDTWDPKPELVKLNGKDVPESIAKDIPKIARSPLNNLFGSPFKFDKHGDSGIEVSELYPELAKKVDELCVIRSMRHETPIHAPAEYLSLTGTQVGDRPSLGAWVTYGLGSENHDLPAFMVFFSNGDTTREPGWSSGFLPARYQGTRVDGGIANLEMPSPYTAASRTEQLQLIERLNRRHLAQHSENSELEARIRSYELAFRMQMSAPEAFDVFGETAETKQLYGLDQKETEEFGMHCLLARRMVERGVRFIQLRHGKWDAHNKLVESHGQTCRYTDRPIAALLTDLRRRGLLDETLVIWGGEFGRTPAAQGGLGNDAGRDHSPSGYTMWLAGGGVRGGQIIGATDPVGYAAIDRPIHPQNLHATMLHALGIDQHKLYYEHNNRKELVTVNGAAVVEGVFA